MEAISPVVRGLMNGYSLGNMIRQQQMAQRQLAMHEKQQQFDQQSNQANLLMRLSDLGARPATQNDQFEMEGGTHVNFDEGLPITGGPSITSTPTTLPARMLTVPGSGQRMVLPTAQERDDRAIAYNQRTLLDRNRAKADEYAREMKMKEEYAARQLDATGVTAPDNVLKQWPALAGRKFPLSQMDEILRAVAAGQNRIAPGAPNPSKVSYVVDQATGNVTPIVPFLDEQGQPQLRSGKPGEGLARPRPRATAEGKGQGTREQRPSFTQTVDALTVRVLEDSAKGGGKTIDDALKNVETYYQNDPQFGTAVRQQIQTRLKKMKAKSNNNPYLEQAAPAADAAAAAGGTSTKTATQAHIKSYAQAKGISEAQALQDFQKSGFTVQ